MSRNYIEPVIKSYSTIADPEKIEFQAGSLNAGVLSIEVPGRGAPGYGRAFATTLTKVLSNGSAYTIPEKPLVGQLWHDRESHRMMTFVGKDATESTSTKYPGWLYIPATASSGGDALLSDLGAVRKSGDTIKWLEVLDDSTFCGPATFHDKVVFSAPHTCSNKVAHTPRVEFNAPVTFSVGATLNLASSFTTTGKVLLKQSSVFGSSGNVVLSGNVALLGDSTISTPETFTGFGTYQFVLEKPTKAISKNLFVIDSPVAGSDPSVLEIGTNGILRVKGKLEITGDLYSSSAMYFSVENNIKPVATGTVPVITKTFNRVVANAAVTSAAGKVRMPEVAIAGLMVMVANDSPYSITLTREHAVDTVNTVAEDVVVGAGARMQFIAYAASSTKVEWALMNSFYG